MVWWGARHGRVVTHAVRSPVRPATRERWVVSIAAARRADHHERHGASAWTQRQYTPQPAIKCSRSHAGCWRHARLIGPNDLHASASPPRPGVACCGGMRRHERRSPCLIGSPTTLPPAVWAMTHPSAMARSHRPTAKKPAPRPPCPKPRLSAVTVCGGHTGPVQCPPLSWYGHHALRALGGDQSIPSLRG
jgi:hypothetical protein